MQWLHDGPNDAAFDVHFFSNDCRIHKNIENEKQPICRRKRLKHHSIYFKTKYATLNNIDMYIKEKHVLEDTYIIEVTYINSYTTIFSPDNNGL